MFSLLCLFGVIIFLIYHYIKINREGDREMEAFDLHCDMYDKYRELVDDPLMSYLKWKESLPIFEAADERCKQLDKARAESLGQVSRFVKRIIEEDGYQQDLKAAR